MVEELKLAIKVDDDSIEQSLLKQFANAQKMADKVVLDFKNVNFDDKEIEAKFKALQKKAGQNPIDLSISKDSIQMLSQISDKLGDIFKIAQGKSIIDSSSTNADIGKIENKLNELVKKYEDLQKKAFGGISGKEVNLVDNDEFKKLSQEVSELKGQFDDLKTHMSLLDDYTVPTDRFFELQTQVEATSVKVSDLVDEMTRLSNIQKNIGSETNISSGNITGNVVPEVEKVITVLDNYGRELDEVSSKILSTSRMMNTKGKLITLFHGSKTDFDNFDIAASDRQNNNLGQGAYFFDNPSNSIGYGDVSQWYANVEKIFINGEKLSEEQLQTIYDKYKDRIKEIFNIDNLTDFISDVNKNVVGKLRTYSDMLGLSTDNDLLKSLGYDAILEKGADVNEYVILDESKIIKANTALKEQVSLITDLQQAKNMENSNEDGFKRNFNQSVLDYFKQKNATQNEGVSSAVQSQETLQSELKETELQAEKTALAVKEVTSGNSDYKSQRKGMKLEYFDGYTDKYDESINAYEQNVVRVVETTDKFAVDAEISCAKAETAVQKFVDSIGNQFPGLQAELNSIKENMSELSDLPYADGANSFGFEPTSDGKGWYVYLNVLKEVQDQTVKTEQAIKEVSSTASEKDLKDAFQGDEVEKASEAISNAVKEENNILEQNTQKAKENAEAKEKMANADKEVSNANFSKYDNRLESYNKKTSGYDATIARFEDGGWTSDAYLKKVQAVKDAVAEYERILNNLKDHPELVTEEGLNDLAKQEKLIKENITAVQNMSAAEKGFTKLSAQKELDKINNILKEHSGMSREAKNQIKAYYAQIKSGNPSASLDVIHAEIMKIVNAEVEAGRAGKSMFDAIKEKAWYGVASAIGTYFGINDIFRYAKEGIQVVREFDTALTEMKKVSDETTQSLKNYQATTFDTADAVGTTALQIQNSTADYMRLGESLEEASESAKTANILLNVSEFDNIEDATKSLVSMGQAYKDLDKLTIVDKLNEVGRRLLPKHTAMYGIFNMLFLGKSVKSQGWLRPRFLI